MCTAPRIGRSFNVHNSREVGDFPTLQEGRDYYYSRPLKLFQALELFSVSGKDIKSATVRRPAARTNAQTHKRTHACALGGKHRLRLGHFIQS
jgi:hypothetical protein